MKCVEVVCNEVYYRCGVFIGRVVKVRESWILLLGFFEGCVRVYG